jgi:hypothetical protein
VWPHRSPVHFDPASIGQPHHQPAAVVARRTAPARCPYLYRQQPISCPASLILGILFFQMTIESTSRDPSTAAEFTLSHATRCKLRHNLPNLLPCPSFCRGYVRLMIHTRISARTPRLDQAGCSHAYVQIPSAPTKMTHTPERIIIQIMVDYQPYFG